MIWLRSDKKYSFAIAKCAFRKTGLGHQLVDSSHERVHNGNDYLIVLLFDRNVSFSFRQVFFILTFCFVLFNKIQHLLVCINTIEASKLCINELPMILESPLVVWTDASVTWVRCRFFKKNNPCRCLWSLLYELSTICIIEGDFIHYSQSTPTPWRRSRPTRPWSPTTTSLLKYPLPSYVCLQSQLDCRFRYNYKPQRVYSYWHRRCSLKTNDWWLHHFRPPVYVLLSNAQDARCEMTQEE